MNKYNLIFLVLNILVFGATESDAQNHYFNKILTQEGEANLSVRRIIQDNHGFLWLATFNGLYRYEGGDYIIQHKFNNNLEINSDVTSLAQDKENNIWIGTNNGLSRYNPVTEEVKTYLHSNEDSLSISDDKIRCINIDKKGNIWIGTREGGLNLYVPESDGFVNIKIEGENIVSPPYIKCILVDNDNKLWIGTWENGAYCLLYADGKTKVLANYRLEDSAHPLSHNYVYCLFKDTDGKIVAGTRSGLNVFDPDSGKMVQYNTTPEYSNGKMTNFFRSVNRNKNGQLWIGTWGGILLCDDFSDLETGNFELVLHNRKNNHSISHDQIMDIFQDKSGSVWIGTENGLNNYDPYQNQFQQISGDIIEELEEQTATAFCPYKDGMLIMTLSHGILFKNEMGTTYFPENNQFAQYGEKLYGLLVDSKNNVWASTFSGLLIKMNGRTQKFTSYKHSKLNVPIYTLAEAENGNILVGTSGEGMKYFNPKTETFMHHSGLTGNVEINDILIDKNKNIWVVAQLGIFKRKAGSQSFEFYLPDTDKKIAEPNVFINIAETAEGEIFVGGRNGLYKYNDSTNSFKTLKFKTSDKLWVTNIQFDSDQNMWLNLNFNRIAKWELNSDKLQFFKVNNGIRSSQYNRRGFFMDSKDRLNLSGFDQIYQFETAFPVENNYSPTPVFTSLIINNTEVHVGTEINNQVILNENINHQNAISLSRRNKDFTLAFTSTTYLNKTDNQYRYKLHGYDNEWRFGKQQQAHYTNLSPGKYTFEVYAANNDGIWSKHPAKLSIWIKPSPLLSLWAIVLYVFVVFAATYQIRKTILGRIHLKQELLIERVKRDKEDKFHQERLQFYTNISHELRTPLTLIMGPIKQLIGKEEEGSDKMRLQQFVLNNAQRLLSLVNQLLDFRKSLYEGMKLKVTHSDLVEIVESNLEAFEFMAKEKSIRTQFLNQSENIRGWFDQEKLDIILFNILSNAYKYTPENGMINVVLKVEPAGSDFDCRHVEIKVLNTGKGIEKNVQDKIFERFYRGDSTAETTNTGTGIGLALVKNLVELHHGKIILESEPGKTTSFTILLPMEKEQYSVEEVFDFKRDADRRTRELIKYTKPVNDKKVPENKADKKQRILIIEDNYELREFLFGFLSEEFQVFTANNGLEGLVVCEKENPDIVLSDIMMDNMDGLQFCEKLKSTSEISHIPVILMTALASAENKMEGYKTGADDYITKPFEPELLKIRIRNILKSRSKLQKGFKNDVNVTAKELTVSKIDEDLIDKIIVLIEKHIDNSDFNKDFLCRELGVSYSYLYRKLKSIAGTSPNDFVQSYRLKKAAQMLKETGLSVSEIAYKVGFNDALYFSKCFKKQFGTSPSKFVQQD